jgi:hypothetical protein
MKAVIVSLSTLGRYGRWDAHFYVSHSIPAKREAVVRSENRLVEEKERLVRLREELRVAEQERQAMIDRGEVVPID